MTHNHLWYLILGNKSKHTIKRQTSNSYEDSSATVNDPNYFYQSSSSYDSQSPLFSDQEQSSTPGYSSQRTYAEDMGANYGQNMYNEESNAETPSSEVSYSETNDQTSQYSSSNYEQTDESQPGKLNDNGQVKKQNIL